MNDRKGNEYHAIKNAINKHLSPLKVNIRFFVQSRQGNRTIRGLRYSRLILERLGFSPASSCFKRNDLEILGDRG